MRRGFMYLMAIIDWFSRYVVAWGLSNTMDVGFCISVLNDALGRGRPDIFNSDQGSQFTSKAFTQRLRISMDGVGRCLDNVFVERLWWSVKHEEVYLSESHFKTMKYQPSFPRRFGCIQDARATLNPFFAWYNHEHRHSGIAYMTPDAVHQSRAATLQRLRSETLLKAFATHPERFVYGAPQPPSLPDTVWINPPRLPARDDSSPAPVCSSLTPGPGWNAQNGSTAAPSCAKNGETPLYFIL